MNRTKITREDIEVPVGILIEVAGMLLDAGIAPTLSGTDGDNDSVTLGVEYEPDDRQVIHDVNDRIDEYHDEEEDDDDEGDDG
jgi:hypothetical protein